MPQNSNWSLDVFNGYTEKSLNNSKSMLLGMRATIAPTSNLDFELLQTIQWGGKQYKNNIPSLLSSIFFNTNDGKNAHINKLGGAGISYKLHNKKFPIRFYAQLIGEDEAGGLPFCFMHLGGVEWSRKEGNTDTLFGFEFVDTRTSLSGTGYCGSNTAYNNNTYKYSNNGFTLGTPIDTESKAIEFFGKTRIFKNLLMKYSIKKISINESNWSNHRLSTVHKNGFVNGINFSLLKNKININGGIHHQGFSLDKADIKKGLGINFHISFEL
jgi:hypothetical protein